MALQTDHDLLLRRLAMTEALVRVIGMDGSVHEKHPVDALADAQRYPRQWTFRLRAHGVRFMRFTAFVDKRKPLPWQPGWHTTDGPACGMWPGSLDRYCEHYR